MIKKYLNKVRKKAAYEAGLIIHEQYSMRIDPDELVIGDIVELKSGAQCRITSLSRKGFYADVHLKAYEKDDAIGFHSPVMFQNNELKQYSQIERIVDRIWV